MTMYEYLTYAHKSLIIREALSGYIIDETQSEWLQHICPEKERTGDEMK